MTQDEKRAQDRAYYARKKNDPAWHKRRLETKRNYEERKRRRREELGLTPPKRAATRPGPISAEMISALAGLNPLDREYFVDNALCGLTPMNIAFRDGVSREVVEERINRARSKLHMALAPQLEQAA